MKNSKHMTVTFFYHNTTTGGSEEWILYPHVSEGREGWIVNKFEAAGHEDVFHYKQNEDEFFLSAEDAYKAFISKE